MASSKIWRGDLFRNSLAPNLRSSLKINFRSVGNACPPTSSGSVFLLVGIAPSKQSSPKDLYRSHIGLLNIPREKGTYGFPFTISFSQPCSFFPSPPPSYPE